MRRWLLHAGRPERSITYGPRRADPDRIAGCAAADARDGAGAAHADAYADVTVKPEVKPALSAADRWWISMQLGGAISDELSTDELLDALPDAEMADLAHDLAEMAEVTALMEAADHLTDHRLKAEAEP